MADTNSFHKYKCDFQITGDIGREIFSTIKKNGFGWFFIITGKHTFLTPIPLSDKHLSVLGGYGSFTIEQTNDIKKEPGDCDE